MKTCELNKNQMILEVCFRDRYNNFFEEDSIYRYCVSKDLQIKPGDIVLINPNVKTKDGFGLNFCKVLDTYPVYMELENGTLLLNTTKEDDIRKAIKPLACLTIDLSDYYKKMNEIEEKEKLRKILQSQVKEYEELAKFKAVAELNPAMKETYDRYMELNNKDLNLKLPDSK